MATQYRIHGKEASAIADSIEAAIREGHFGSGARLPAVRTLARRLTVSPTTVASAYRRLRIRGLVSARRRAGTSVSPRPPLSTRPKAPVPAHARNLADGNPDPALLPPIGGALGRLDVAPRLYTERAANPELLALAARQFTDDGVPARSLAVVSGALDGIERVLQAHVRPGDRVVVEDPGFTGVLDLVSALGLVVEPVTVDDFGPVPADLARALGRRVEACIVTPRAQNPTGAALDRRRATELRRVLAAHPDVLVVEDDHAGPVAGVPAITLADRDRARWAVVRSVSKSLGPDLRLAILAGDATTIARVEGRQLVGAGWVSHILQGLVVALWSDPRTIRRLRDASAAYAARRAALISGVRASRHHGARPIRDERVGASVRGGHDGAGAARRRLGGERWRALSNQERTGGAHHDRHAGASRRPSRRRGAGAHSRARDEHALGVACDGQMLVPGDEHAASRSV